jgi:hypothetical protein
LTKRPRQQPIKCWGGEGDLMYKYCLHQGDKMNTMHKMKQEEIVEDVGRDCQGLERIYLTLGNRQEEY